MTAERLLDERYEIVRTLGAGAAGQLFEVRDLQREGDIAALKVLRPRERDPGLVPLFREEFLLLAGIDHPSVVRARDFGVLSSGEPYFTMDFVPGENARVLVAEDRLEPVDYIDLCSSVLGALARVHAQGILHRDLKPENIIVRRSGERLAPVLVDFGLAGDMVEGSTAVSGTPPYIAPEVIAGAAPDARADLFGFGMALYEICTGRRPGEAKQLLRDATRLLAPDKLRTSLDRQARDSVPKKFEDFLVRLLAANPAARYPTAGAALDALASIYEADIEVPTEGLRAAVHSVQAPLVGRDAAQKAMLDRIDALREGKLLEPLVVVAGRAGYGVTRLLQSVRHQASAAGCEVFAGRTLAELGRAVAARHEGMRVEGAAPHEIIFQLDAALQDPSVRELPVLLLDDVHQMSDAAVQSVREWVASMESRRGRVRALVVLGGCSEGGSAGAELLASAGRAVPLELRDLAPLTETDLRRALSILLGGAAVPMPLVETLHRATDGAPRAFAELLDLLVESGALDVAADPPRLDEEKLRATTLPQSVIEIARARAEDASDAAREALGRMALLPVPAPLRVARVLAGPALDELLDRGLLVRQGALIDFPYDLARRAHDLWDAEDRRATAHALADALGEEDAPYRAYLWIAAGDRVRAVEIGREAADAMMREGRTDEARALLREICGDEPDEATATAYLRALVATGAVEEATRFGTRLLEKQRSSAILFATANALSRLRRLDEALRLFERHEPWLEGVSRVRLHQGRAVVHLQQQNFTAAYESSLAAERLAGGIHGMGGAVASVRARIFRERCWLQRAKQLYDIALEGDLTGVTREITRLNRAGLLLTLGRIVPALRGMRGVKPARGGLTYAMMQMALSDAFGHVGRYARALRHVEVGREIQRAAARAKFVAWCLQHEAKLLLLLGRPAEGEARLLRARSLPGVQDDAEAQEEVRIAQSAFLMYAGQMTAARELVEGDGEAGEAEAMRRAMARARIAQLEGEDAGETLAAWREVVSWASLRRDRLVMAHARVGLAEAYAQQGAWRFAEQLVERGRGDLFACRTPVRARALMLRAAAALQRNEPGTAGRLLEESIAIANRCDDAPLRAELYATAASILEEPVMQRFLREPTAAASAALLEVAREIWAVYGNETMLRKIDLHLSELPRPATEAGGGPEADRLVKILHIAREMNRELDRDSLLGLILDRAIELTGAERGFVILLEGGREEIRLARNLDRESVSEPEQKISSQIIREVIDTGRIVRSEDAEFDSHFEESLSVRQLRLKSVIAVPFRSAARTIGALYLDNRFRTANFTEREERLLELFADQAVVAIDRAALVRELEAKSQELKDAVRLRDREVKNKAKQMRQVEKENRQHRRARGFGFDRIVARSGAMKQVVRDAKRLAQSDLSVLVNGENGTGKEMVARAVHYASRREGASFVAVNCAAFAEGLLESELFGHVRGSFSGADRDRVGLLEEASGGTLFLDEVGEMSLPMQVKLLRALELGEVRRVGDSKVRRVDVRVIAATNADLDDFVRVGRFREDLKFRLAGAVLTLPPLRDRLEDLEPLALAFVQEAVALEGVEPIELTTDALARLERYPWPGNVRELRNVILRAVVAADGNRIGSDGIVFDARSGALLPGFDSEQADQIVEELAEGGVELNARQQSAIARVLSHGKMSFAEFQRLFRVSKSTTSRDLEGLLSLELLQKRGKTRATVYLVGPRLREIAQRIGPG